MSKDPVVELKLPIIPDIELSATKTAEVISKHMNLSEEKSAEVSMALIESCINAFEHSKTKEIFIHFIVEPDKLTVKVIDKGVGFDKSKVEIPNIENKLNSDERKRGWGLQLVSELMDSVEYNSDESGTTVTMTKKRDNE
ncbi:MAG: anti-sigma regulatory factor [Cytophagia bacterium]|jgi:Anti-sigma regulatory factor (Ser/Thr protein kinase)|nr:anti-sigma regulatory factor [Cytophagia bacterium]|tara:strand:+ start:491 stop:910 length:420 start_codon:yes stop_codon:yes gene_type:complete